MEIKTESHVETSSTSPKPAIEQRIAFVKQNLATQPPSSTKTSMSNLRNKCKMFATKVSNISKSLLSQDQPIEIASDDDQEGIEDNEEIIEDNEEIIEGNNENTEDNKEKDHDTSTTRRRTKRRRSNRT